MKTQKTNLPEINNNSISIFPKKNEDIHGIFALLKDLNGDYRSRYKINSLSENSVAPIDKYYNGGTGYISNENDLIINITFDSPFLLSGYSISNKVYQDDKNSFPSNWVLYGQNPTNSNSFYVLDTQTDQQFCNTKFTCTEEHINTYDTTKVYRAMKPFKTFIFHQLKNSCGFDYILMKAFDLYGTLCGIDGKCSFIHYTCRSYKAIKKTFVVCVVFLIFSR